MLWAVLLVSSASAIVTLEPGPLCPEQQAVVRCAITGGTQLSWVYSSNNDIVAGIDLVLGQFPPMDAVIIKNVSFTVTLISNMTELVSEIRFMVSSRINGQILTCSGLEGSQPVTSSITLQEENNGNYCGTMNSWHICSIKVVTRLLTSLDLKL